MFGEFGEFGEGVEEFGEEREGWGLGDRPGSGMPGNDAGYGGRLRRPATEVGYGGRLRRPGYGGRALEETRSARRSLPTMMWRGFWVIKTKGGPGWGSRAGRSVDLWFRHTEETRSARRSLPT